VEFDYTLGAEGTSHAIDTRDNTVYASNFYGNLERMKVDGKKSKRLLPERLPGEKHLRGQWMAPTILSPHNPDIVYHGMQYVLMSRDRGNTWERISPDLSANNPAKQGDINFQTLTSISESPKRFGLIYAGTDDGRIWRTMNGGKKWVEIRSGKVPARWVSRLVASAYDLGTVYLTQTGRRDDDFQVYIWKSTDFGGTWTDISGNIPVGPVNVIREDLKDRNRLYAGTDAGVYFSRDGGKKWEVLGNLPFAYIHDLAIHPRDKILVAATHGRGLWAFDTAWIDRSDKDRAEAAPPLSAEQKKVLLGNWLVDSDAGYSFVLKFIAKEDVLTGKMTLNWGEAELSRIRFDGKKLSFTAVLNLEERLVKLQAEITIEDDKITGTLTSPWGKSVLSGEKEKKQNP
jgi:hypothetical protein